MKVIPAVDWIALAQQFPTHREHIRRVRNDPKKLARLSQRLIGHKVKQLRQLRDGKPVTTVPKVLSLHSIFKRLGIGGKKVISSKGE